MFSKKILSIVGLLFVSSKVYATYDECDKSLSTKGCIASVCDADDDGYYLFNYKIVSISNGNCEFVTDNGFYLLKPNGAMTKKIDGDTYYGSDTAALDCQDTYDGGIFSGDSVFCLEQGKPLVLGSNGSYLFTDNSGVFTNSVIEKKVIVKSTGEAVVLDKELMDKTYNYCVDSNLRVWNRKEELCTNSSGECEYYQCANGECKKEAANLPPLIERANPECNLDSPNDEKCIDKGYYLYGSNDRTNVLNTEEAGNVGSLKLAQCTKNAQSGEWLCSDVTGADIPIGYVPNAGAGGEYIKCVNGGTCTAEADIETRLKQLTEGTYMIDINTSGLLEITNESSKYVNVIRTGNSVYVDRESEGYYTVSSDAEQTRAYPVDNAAAADLYSCAKDNNISKCEKVDSDIPIGYLINKGVGSSEKPFIKCNAGKSCQAVAPGDDSSCNTNNHGDLYVVDGSTKICGVTDGSTNELILAGNNAINDVKYYIASVSTAYDKLFGIENKTDYFIVLKFEGGNVTVENDPNARYRYTKKNSNLIVLRNDTSGGICEASANGNYSNAYEYILANWSNAIDDLTDGISYYVSEDYN